MAEGLGNLPADAARFTAGWRVAKRMNISIRMGAILGQMLDVWGVVFYSENNLKAVEVWLFTRKIVAEIT